MAAALVPSTARQSTRRAPLRSRIGPSFGDVIAASTPPSETAPDSAVRVQPKSWVIGATNIDSVATAPPWRANPAQQAQNSTTQP